MHLKCLEQRRLNFFVLGIVLGVLSSFLSLLFLLLLLIDDDDDDTPESVAFWVVYRFQRAKSRQGPRLLRVQQNAIRRLSFFRGR